MVLPTLTLYARGRNSLTSSSGHHLNLLRKNWSGLYLDYTPSRKTPHDEKKLSTMVLCLNLCWVESNGRDKTNTPIQAPNPSPLPHSFGEKNTTPEALYRLRQEARTAAKQGRAGDGSAWWARAHLVPEAGQQLVHDTLQVVVRDAGPLGVLGRQGPEQLAAPEAHGLIRRPRVPQQELHRPLEKRGCFCFRWGCRQHGFGGPVVIHAHTTAVAGHDRSQNKYGATARTHGTRSRVEGVRKRSATT